ncbi:hypothetical protein G6F65_020346 [Rhizopus arrhizus]|nr:hypothetical protein G6F65_020346 [Rhizopus arrhizus]
MQRAVQRRVQPLPRRAMARALRQPLRKRRAGRNAGLRAGETPLPFDRRLAGARIQTRHTPNTSQQRRRACTMYLRTMVGATFSRAAISTCVMPSSWLYRNAIRALADSPSSAVSSLCKDCSACTRSSADGSSASGCKRNTSSHACSSSRRRHSRHVIRRAIVISIARGSFNWSSAGRQRSCVKVSPATSSASSRLRNPLRSRRSSHGWSFL